MSTIQTDFTRLLGIRTPIVLAPMSGASGGALASEVSLAGGFGFLAPGVENFRDEFDVARSILNVPSGPLPIGAGFLGWKLEEARSPHVALLELALENGVRAIWLSFGEDLGRWIELVRIHDEKSGKSPKTLVFVQVNSVDEALIAAYTWKVDVLVAQGIESGGHGSSHAPPVLNLVPQVLSALPPSSGAPPVLAAGGLSSGAHLAAFLTLGAAGAVVGTRFLLAEESQYSDAQKRAIIAAKAGSAVRSFAFDELRGTTGWPAGRGADVARIKEQVGEGSKKGDPDTCDCLGWYGGGTAGQASAREGKGVTRTSYPLWVDCTPTNKDIVRELHDAAVARLEASSVLVGDDA
ncbi:2-nitropropane dioxygenase [Russula earlei]|uniref:2-nitropropane dioxygenase n=1 Tax=Russula earlei TaxID=71964 RepID=A0ACC0UKF3_9AGAM|nr:2-nitropropane dioxygenase [Russula earlei]